MKKQLILSFAFSLGLSALGLTSNVEKNIRYSDAALQAEADDIYEQLGAIRPAVSRVTIKPSK